MKTAGRPILVHGLVGVLVAIFVVLAAAAPASAVEGHRFSREIGSSGPGKLDSVGDIAIRPSDGHLFALEPSTRTVKQFNQSGDFLGGFTVAEDVIPTVTNLSLDPSNGDVLVAGYGSDSSDDGYFRAIARYPSAGGPPQLFDTSALGDVDVHGLAVDGAGRTFATNDGEGDGGANALVFSSSGQYADRFDGTRSGAPLGGGVGPVAVDESNNVYLASSSGVRKLSSAGVSQGLVSTDYAAAIGIARGSGDRYFVDTPDGSTFGVTRFSSAGARQERFADGRDAGSLSSIAIDSASRTAFVANRNKPSIDVYVPYTAAEPNTGAATNVGQTSADIAATVNPRNTATSYVLEYGPDSNYGTTAASGDATGNATTAASASLASLRPNKTYHYRLRATNSEGTNFGRDRTFTTLPGPAGVSGESATPTSPTTATLNATVSPYNKPTTAHFEYGADTGGAITYGSRTAERVYEDYELSEDQPLTADVMRLAPDTLYHYRVVASNGVGSSPTKGADQTFRTPPAMPIATAEAATAIAGDTAQLNATVDTQGLQGNVTFLVAARNSPYSTRLVVPVSAVTGLRSVSTTVSGLPAGGVYDVRVLVTTTTGSVFSGTTAFATGAAATPAPTAALGSLQFSFGCAAPRLAQPSATLKAGKAITLTGQDLGVGGSVAFGSRSGEITSYSSSRIRVVVPSTASGRVPIRVNCGRASNTVTARVTGAAPSNRFTTSTSVKATRATVKVKVPGRGAVSVSAKQIGRKSASSKKAGTVSIKVALTKSARAALATAKSKRLSVKVAVRYHPTGGVTRSVTRTLVFRH